MGKKAVSIDFSAFTGGLNTVDDPLRLAANQVQNGTINAILTDQGATRRPGFIGIDTDAVFAALLKGLHIYTQEDASETLLGLSGGKVYSIVKTTGALTELYNLTGTGEGWFRDYKDKAWVCNGSGFAKIENTAAYRVGIAAPSGATAAAKAGGSLPDGVYKIYLGYYRKVSGTIVLYSKGQSVADVTLGSGNNTVTVSIPDSADPQVGGGVIWMTDAAGAVHYQYKTLDGAGAYVFDVADATAKNVSLLYAVEAVDNNVPANFTFIEIQNNIMWGVDPTIKHRVWYSMKSGTVYDLERFPAQNFIDYPFEVTGLISLGSHLYINTKAGMIIQPYADPSVKFEWIDHRYFFEYMRTVAYWGNMVIGLTNDGVRTFDGAVFSSDLTWKIKNIVETISSSPANHAPCGWIMKRESRTEYHLSYMLQSVSTVCNNRELILNMDTMQAVSATQAFAPWELWGVGCEYCAVDKGNVTYRGQSVTDAATICKEAANTVKDQLVYSDAGVFLTAATENEIKVITRNHMPSLNARCRFNKIRILAKLNENADITVTIGDRYAVSGLNSIGAAAAPSRFGVARFGISKFSTEIIDTFRKYLPMTMCGYSCFVTISQTADDTTFQVLAITVEGEAITGRFV